MNAEICRQCLDACEKCKEYKDSAVSLLMNLQQDMIRLQVMYHVYFDYIAPRKRKKALEEANKMTKEVKTNEDLIIFLKARISGLRKKLHEVD